MARMYLHGEDVVRHIEQAGGVLVRDGGEARCLAAAKGTLPLEPRGRSSAVSLGLSRPLRALEGFRLAALSLPKQRQSTTPSEASTHAAAGEALRGGERPGQGQLEHEVCAARGGASAPGELRPDRSLAALDKVAGHGADHGGVRSQRLPRPVYERLCPL